MGHHQKHRHPNDTMDSILYELFDKVVTKDRADSPTDHRTQTTEAAGYITHGIKEKEWKAKIELPS